MFYELGSKPLSTSFIARRGPRMALFWLRVALRMFAGSFDVKDLVNNSSTLKSVAV